METVFHDHQGEEALHKSGSSLQRRVLWSTIEKELAEIVGKGYRKKTDETTFKKLDT